VFWAGFKSTFTHLEEDYLLVMWLYFTCAFSILNDFTNTTDEFKASVIPWVGAHIGKHANIIITQIQVIFISCCLLMQCENFSFFWDIRLRGFQKWLLFAKISQHFHYRCPTYGTICSGVYQVHTKMFCPIFFSFFLESLFIALEFHTGWNCMSQEKKQYASDMSS